MKNLSFSRISYRDHYYQFPPLHKVFGELISISRVNLNLLRNLIIISPLKLEQLVYVRQQNKWVVCLFSENVCVLSACGTAAVIGFNTSSVEEDNSNVQLVYKSGERDKYVVGLNSSKGV